MMLEFRFISQQSARAEDAFIAQRDLADKLLLNIMPQSVAEELKQRGKYEPRPICPREKIVLRPQQPTAPCVMNLLLATLIALFALCTGMALHYYFGLRRALRRAETELAELRRLTATDSPRPAGDAPFMRMLVEVKDPIALAHRESPLAKLASGTAPNVVTKKVYEQVVAQTRQQLKDKNVEAEVSIIVI
jgi:hypothetical protein